jgi:hypothetical protein
MPMRDHWRQFFEDVPWFPGGRNARPSQRQPPGSWRPHSPDFGRLFPELTGLLESSFVTQVAAAGREYVLHSWERPDGQVRSWLCARAPNPVPPGPCVAHRVLLESFGGMVERSNEPETSWLLNHEEVLTARLAEQDAKFIEAYAWAFEDTPGGIPIDLQAYYPIAREANGNTTLCHRLTGDVLLFAPDHAFDHVVPLDACPEFTLYRIRGAASFTHWVAAVSRQWSQP